MYVVFSSKCLPWMMDKLRGELVIYRAGHRMDGSSKGLNFQSLYSMLGKNRSAEVVPRENVIISLTDA